VFRRWSRQLPRQSTLAGPASFALVHVTSIVQGPGAAYSFTHSVFVLVTGGHVHVCVCFRYRYTCNSHSPPSARFEKKALDPSGRVRVKADEVAFQSVDTIALRIAISTSFRLNPGARPKQTPCWISSGLSLAILFAAYQLHLPSINLFISTHVTFFFFLGTSSTSPNRSRPRLMFSPNPLSMGKP
jgi:hypothetical protein